MHTEAELGVSRKQARALLVDPAQSMLDFGVEPTPLVAGLAPEPGEPGLFDVPGRRTRDQQGRGRDDPGRVVAIGPWLLHGALVGVYNALGFNVLGDETSRTWWWRGSWNRPRYRTVRGRWPISASRRRPTARTFHQAPGHEL